jgi:hypothetical protein
MTYKVTIYICKSLGQIAIARGMLQERGETILGEYVLGGLPSSMIGEVANAVYPGDQAPKLGDVVFRQIMGAEDEGSFNGNSRLVVAYRQMPS